MEDGHRETFVSLPREGIEGGLGPPLPVGGSPRGSPGPRHRPSVPSEHAPPSGLRPLAL